MTASTLDNSATTVASRRLVAVACGAAGLISVGTGIYCWTRARSLSVSADRTIADRQTTYDDGRCAEEAQWILSSVCAAAVPTGAGLYLHGRRLSAVQQTSVSLAPMAAPGAVGRATVGAF